MELFHKHNFNKEGDELWCSCGEIRKLTPRHTCSGEVGKFKKGDKVRVIAHWLPPKGKVGKIYGLTEGGYYVEYKDGGTNSIKYCEATNL